MNVPSLRDKQDFVTNPCWIELREAIEEMLRVESCSLQSRSREGDITAVNVQGGVIEGIMRVEMRLRNLQEQLSRKSAA